MLTQVEMSGQRHKGLEPDRPNTHAHAHTFAPSHTHTHTHTHIHTHTHLCHSRYLHGRQYVPRQSHAVLESDPEPPRSLPHLFEPRLAQGQVTVQLCDLRRLRVHPILRGGGGKLHSELMKSCGEKKEVCVRHKFSCCTRAHEILRGDRELHINDRLSWWGDYKFIISSNHRTERESFSVLQAGLKAQNGKIAQNHEVAK